VHQLVIKKNFDLYRVFN